MGFSPVLLFVSAIIASSSGFAIQNGATHCPPPEQIAPCTCSEKFLDVTALCQNISNQATIQDVFSKNIDWKLQDVHFDQCSFDYIPSSIVKTANFQSLNISSSTLVSLFDDVLAKTPEITIHLIDVKILRGVQWEYFSNSTLVGFEVRNGDIKNFGNSFKQHMPQTVKYMALQNTKIERITHQAFQRLVNVNALLLEGGSLKKLSRDMFPRPWNIMLWSLRQQKIAALPNDFFADLPRLTIFNAEGNFFTTISEEVFTSKSTGYILIGNPINCNCGVKWITTSGKKSNKIFKGTCAEPESFKGKELDSLTEADFSYCK